MTMTLKSAEIARQEPAVNDRLEGKFGVVEIMRHDGLTANCHFAHAFGIGTQNAKLDARQRLANRIRAKRLQIIECQRRSSLAETVAIHHRNAEIVEELH